MSKATAAILELTTSLDDKGLKELDKKLKKAGLEVEKLGNTGQVSIKQIDQSSKKAGGSLAGMAAQAVGVAMAFSQIYQETKAVVNEQRKMKQVLTSTGQAAGLSYKELQKMAGAMQSVTTFKKADILRAQNTLLTFTGVGKDAFQDVLTIGMDMAAFFGGDLQSHIIRVGKAFQSPAEQAAALRDVGVNLNQQQIELIKNFEKAGNKAAAQAVILKELKTEFGGAAEAMAQSGIGKIEQATARFKDVMVSVGEVLLPPVAEVATVLSTIFGWFTKLPGPIKAVTVALVGMGVAFMASSPLGWISGAILAIGGLISMFKKTEKSLNDIKMANKEIEDTALKASKSFNQEKSMDKHLQKLKNLKQGTSEYKREVEAMLRLSPALQRAGITAANSYATIESAVDNLNQKLSYSRRLSAGNNMSAALTNIKNNDAWFTAERISRFSNTPQDAASRTAEETRFYNEYNSRLEQNKKAAQLFFQSAKLAGIALNAAVTEYQDILKGSGIVHVQGVGDVDTVNTRSSSLNSGFSMGGHTRTNHVVRSDAEGYYNTPVVAPAGPGPRTTPHNYGSGSGATGSDWDWQKEIKKLKSEFVQLKAGTMWQQAAKSLYGDQFKKQVDLVKAQFTTLQEEKKAMINSEFDQRDKAAKAAFDKDRTKQAEYSQYQTKSAENRKLKLQAVDDEYRLYTAKAETDLLLKRYQFEYDTASGTNKQILGIKISGLQREQQIREKYAHDADAMEKALAQARIDTEKEISAFKKSETDKVLQSITTGIDTATRLVDTLADSSKAVEERLFDSAQMIASQFGPTGQLVSGGIGLAKSIFGAFSKESQSWSEIFLDQLEQIISEAEQRLEAIEIQKTVVGEWDLPTLRIAANNAADAVEDMFDAIGLDRMTQEQLSRMQQGLVDFSLDTAGLMERFRSDIVPPGATGYTAALKYQEVADEEQLREYLRGFVPDDLLDGTVQAVLGSRWSEVNDRVTEYINTVKDASPEIITALSDERKARLALLTAANNQALAELEHKKAMGKYEDDEMEYYNRKLEILDQNAERIRNEIELYGANAELQAQLRDMEEERYATQQAINQAKNEEYQIDQKYLQGAKGKKLQELLDMREKLKLQIETGEVRYDQRTASILQLLDRKIVENLQGQGAGRDAWWQYQADAAQITKDMYGEKYFTAMSGTGQAVYLPQPDLSHLMPVSSASMMPPQITVNPTPAQVHVQTPVQINANAQMPPDVMNWFLDLYKQNTGQDLGGM